MWHRMVRVPLTILLKASPLWPGQLSWSDILLLSATCLAESRLFKWPVSLSCLCFHSDNSVMRSIVFVGLPGWAFHAILFPEPHLEIISFSSTRSACYLSLDRIGPSIPMSLAFLCLIWTPNVSLLFSHSRLRYTSTKSIFLLTWLGTLNLRVWLAFGSIISFLPAMRCAERFQYENFFLWNDPRVGNYLDILIFFNKRDDTPTIALC